MENEAARRRRDVPRLGFEEPRVAAVRRQRRLRRHARDTGGEPLEKDVEHRLAEEPQRNDLIEAQCAEFRAERCLPRPDAPPPDGAGQEILVREAQQRRRLRKPQPLIGAIRIVRERQIPPDRIAQEGGVRFAVRRTVPQETQRFPEEEVVADGVELDEQNAPCRAACRAVWQRRGACFADEGRLNHGGFSAVPRVR